MVEVTFIDGQIESFEPKPGSFHWTFDKNSECFILDTTEGHVSIPRDFIKMLKYTEV